jgi:multidrug efflux system outer membrane protein
MRGFAFSLRLVPALVLAMGLGGCLLGPDYVRQNVPTPANFRFAANEAADTANTRWWEQFQDPVLNDLILAALADNKDVKIAAARVDQFLGQFVTTRSGLFPQVSAGFDASRQRASQLGPTPIPAGVSPVFNEFQAPLSVAWEVDLFGRVRRETESARASLLASEEGRRATILSLVASVATAYINLRDLDQRSMYSRRVSPAATSRRWSSRRANPNMRHRSPRFRNSRHRLRSRRTPCRSCSVATRARSCVDAN